MPNSTLEKWEEKTIKQLSTLICDGDWIESKNQAPSGIRLIQTGNIGDGYYKDKPENSRYVSEETFKKLNCTEIYSGDCLVSRLPEPLGRACLIPDRNERMITAVDCSIIRFNNKNIIPKYFIYYSMSNSYHNKIIKLSTGSTRQRISRKNLETITVPLPDKNVQQRLVKILDEAFENIEKAKQNALQNLNNSKELFESCLTAILNTGSSGHINNTFSQEFKIKSGDFLSAQNMNLNGKYSVYGGNGINGKHDSYNYTGENIIIGRVGEKCGNIHYVNDNIWVTDNAFVLLGSTHNFDKKFLYYFLTKLNLRQYATKTTHPVISGKSLKDVMLSFPADVLVQQKIVAQLDELQEQTKKLEQIYAQKIKDLDELKQSILQKAFNGEL